MNTTAAIVRSVGRGLERCELTFVGREPIDAAFAASQHAAYVDALRNAGVKVAELPPDDDLPDSVFVEDCAVVLDEAAIITRPAPESRRPEIHLIKETLRRFRSRIVTIEAPGTIEGGDVLRIGRRLFVGMSTRTNAAGFEQFASAAAAFGYQTIPVAVTGSLHLKTAVTALDGRTIVMNPDWIDRGAFRGMNSIVVPDAEPFGANTLQIGDRVFVSESSPATARLIQQAGFETVPIAISELEKAEAGLTCMSLVFNRDEVP